MNPNEIIIRDQLMDHVLAGKNVSDSTISSEINIAQKALGDDDNKQNFVQTVDGKGLVL